MFITSEFRATEMHSELCVLAYHNFDIIFLLVITLVYKNTNPELMVRKHRKIINQYYILEQYYMIQC